MSDTSAGRPDGARAEADAPPSVEDRGRLVVADRVVERVAGHAVTRVPDAAAAPRRVLGMNVGEARPEGVASVDARVQDDLATIHVTIAVRWPRSVKDVAEAVREHIRSEVTTIAGMRVDHVDVDVVSLTLPEAAEARVQ